MPESTPGPRTAPRRLGLIGGEGTGKSTLALALARALPACVVDESLRAFVAREGRTPRRDEQAALMREQAAREEAMAGTCPHPALVADPAPLMTAVYSVLYFDDDSLVAPAVRQAAGYDLVAWCRPDVPWADDGIQRDGDGHRAAADTIIARLVHEELVPRGIRVIAAEGDVDHRVAALTRAWQRSGPHSPT
jgi:nicotinamide riboside kinase